MRPRRCWAPPWNKSEFAKIVPTPGFVGTNVSGSAEKMAWFPSGEIAVTSEELNRLDMGLVLEAICQGCDVEISIGSHCVAVTGIQKLADGNYSLDMTHDEGQGLIGGQTTETVTYDNVFGVFHGAPWCENKVPKVTSTFSNPLVRWASALAA